MPIASCSLDLIAHRIFFHSFQKPCILQCHCFIMQACHLLGFRQSHSALTLLSDDAFAISAADAIQAILPALSSVISKVLLLQASCQARHPSRTHSQSICICHSPLLLMKPARPSTTAMPNYSELHANKVSDILLVQAKASLAKIRRGARCCTAPGRCQLACCPHPSLPR